MLDPHTGLYYHRLKRPAFEPVRFLTFSCFHELPLFQNDLIKDAFADALARFRTRPGVRLPAWVIMPTHVHLLVELGVKARLRNLLQSLKGCFARKVLARWRQLRAPILDRLVAADGTLRFWEAGGGYDRTIRSAWARVNAIDYIHNNPVEAGLVGRPWEWRWSSVHEYLGQRGLQSQSSPL